MSTSAYVYPPPRVELVDGKIDTVEILCCSETANYIQFRA